jgi:hypothetical protein
MQRVKRARLMGSGSGSALRGESECEVLGRVVLAGDEVELNISHGNQR